MIPTNTNLPIHIHQWEPVCRMTETKWQDVCVNCGAHRIVETAPALHDECSGLAELQQHQRGGAVAAVTLLSAAFSAGMIFGALIVFVLVITFTK